MRELSNWLESYIDYTSCLESPVKHRLWSAIAIISSALQRKCYIDWGTLTFYPNMYIILVGPPGTRKSTIINQAHRFIENIDVRISTFTDHKKLTKVLAESIYGGITKSDLVYLYNSITILSNEFTMLLKDNDLVLNLCDWYDCRNVWTYITKHRGINKISNIYVTLLGATSNFNMETITSIDVVKNSLMLRSIFVCEQDKSETVGYPDGKKIDLEKSLINDLHRIYRLEGKFIATNDFIDCWKKWYSKQDNIEAYKDTNIIKLSIIISASKTDNMSVTSEDLAGAISIIENLT